MALQVWLPLNGDLKNKGCADVTITNNGATVDNNGKIGKCYKFTEDSDSIKIDNFMPILKNYNNYSLCAWIYMTSAATNHSTTILSSGNWNTPNANFVFALYNYSSGYTKLLVPNTQSWNTVSINLSNKLVINTWYHIVVTYDGTTTTAYVNGEVVGSVSSGGICEDSNSDNVRVGGATYYDGFTLKGNINDVRIYDHCLSAAEVKEISKGLVVHYPLNRLLIKNLINFDLTADNYTINNYSNRTPGTIANGIYHADGYQSETYADTSFGILSKNYVTLKADTDYYLSFYCKSKSAANLYFGTSGQAYTGLRDDGNNYFRSTQNVNIGTEYAGYVVLKVHTGTPTQYRINLGFDGPNIWGIGSFIEFSKIMLTSVEPYLNSSYDENAIPDCSGYGNNGEITGDLTISNDTPRYDNCIQNNSSYLLGSVFDFPESKGLTITGWVCVETRGYQVSGLWATSTNSTTNPNDYNQTTCSHTDTYFRMRGTDGNLYSITCNTQDVPLNTWKHIALTHDGTDIKLYIDGTFVRSISCPTSLVGFKSFWLGRANSNRYTQGKWSDFRIYATALSEEDVKQLYEVSGKVDKSGNLHSYEFNELHVGRELLVRNITNGYTSTTSTYTNYSEDGIEFNGRSSAGSDYIEINPSTNKYIYDYTISVSTGNQFYIGFERYDENKTTRSNQACVYTFWSKPTSDIVKKRYTGVVNLATDGVNPCKYIRLRILNGWTGTDSSSTKLATIHNLSLREVPTSTTDKTKLYKTGIFESDLLLEGNTKVEIEKNLDANVNQLIEM